jgi:hypothetical protein
VISSDPHAWLRPYFHQLAGEQGFSLLAPAIQFELLVAAVTEDQPQKAAQMREWSPTAQQSILGWLRSVTRQAPPQRQVELWRVTKGERELRCIAVYTPAGTDLRLMLGEDFRRTELFKDAPALESRAAQWLEALVALDW